MDNEGTIECEDNRGTVDNGGRMTTVMTIEVLSTMGYCGLRTIEVLSTMGHIL